MDGLEFIALAQRMAASGGDRAWFRTVSSRAYYGAFHGATEFLAELNVHPTKTERVHFIVHAYLENSMNRPSENAGRLLGDLHVRRKEADYKLASGPYETAAFARYSVEMALRIRELIVECTTDPLRTAVHRAVLEYQNMLRGKK